MGSSIKSDNSDSINSAIFRSGTFVLAGKMIRHMLMYGTQLFLINLLAPQDFGMVRYVTILVSFAILLNEMGLTTALVQKEKLYPEEIGVSFLLSLFWGLILYAAVYIIAPYAETFLNAEKLTFYLRAGAIVIIFSAATSVHNAILQRTMRYGMLAKIEAVAAIISSSATITLAALGYGAWALVAGSLSYQCTSAVIIMFTVKIPKPELIPFSRFKPLFYFGLGIIVLRLCDYARYSIPFLITGKFLNEANLGLFSFAYDLAMLPRTIVHAIYGNVVLVSFSRFQNDPGSVNKSFASITIFTSLFAVPLLLMMSVMSEEVMQIICFLKKDSEWINAAIPLRWMALTGVMYTLTIFPESLWISKGKVGSTVMWNFFMFVTMVMATYVGLQWGLEGICIAILIRSIVVFALFLFINYRITAISPLEYTRLFLPAFACSCFMIPVILITVSGISWPSHWPRAVVLISGSLTGFASYMLCLRFGFKSSFLQSLNLLSSLKIPKSASTVDWVKRVLQL
jgi:O-antigen/teichoic acid export membrane protein